MSRAWGNAEPISVFVEEAVTDASTSDGVSDKDFSGVVDCRVAESSVLTEPSSTVILEGYKDGGVRKNMTLLNIVLEAPESLSMSRSACGGGALYNEEVWKLLGRG